MSTFTNDQHPQRGFKQMKEGRKLAQGLNKKIRNVNEKFSKEIEILKKNQTNRNVINEQLMNQIKTE
jgi:hypothetical protein